MIFIKPLHNNWSCCIILASHLSTLDRVREESECEEGDESEFEPLTKRLCSTTSGCVHQLSYSSSVSTFCRNEIKDRNYRSAQQHILISFSFSGKKW